MLHLAVHRELAKIADHAVLVEALVGNQVKAEWGYTSVGAKHAGKAKRPPVTPEEVRLKKRIVARRRKAVLLIEELNLQGKKVRPIIDLIESRQWKGSFAGRVLGLFGVHRGLKPALARLAQEGEREGVAPDQVAETLALARRAREGGSYHVQADYGLLETRPARVGADGVALSNSALQAIGCLGMRACHTNNCPVGIATQKPHLMSRLVVDKSALQLKNFFEASVELMRVMARACGHDHLSKFSIDDLTTWKPEMAALSGVAFGGAAPLAPSPTS